MKTVYTAGNFNDGHSDAVDISSLEYLGELGDVVTYIVELGTPDQDHPSLDEVPLEVGKNKRGAIRSHK